MIRRQDVRVVVEWVLHAAAISAIVALLWRSLHPATTFTSASVTGSQLPTLVSEWTRSGAPDSIHLSLSAAPDAVTRDWLVALRRAGSVTSWSGDSLTPTAISAEPVVDPRGGVIVRIGAPEGVRTQLIDDAGVIDSSQARTGLNVFRLAALAGKPRGRARAQNLGTSVSDSVLLRRVLVLGRVGWEAKFTIAALEERGWKVDARMQLAPGQAVTQGAIVGIDTARYSAVVALDTAGITNSAAILRYVNDGGGLVIAGSATASRQFAAVLPGRAGSRVAPRQRLIDTSDAAGARYPIIGLRSDAIVLERDDSIVTVAARRAGAGRVIQVADEETWRRRMRPAPGSVEGHREWWARIVGSAAYAPRAGSGASSDEAAPVASLIAALGPPTSLSPDHSPMRDDNFELWMFALLSIALLTEWASRRWRGAP